MSDSHTVVFLFSSIISLNKPEFNKYPQNLCALNKIELYLAITGHRSSLLEEGVTEWPCQCGLVYTQCASLAVCPPYRTHSMQIDVRRTHVFLLPNSVAAVKDRASTSIASARFFWPSAHLWTQKEKKTVPIVGLSAALNSSTAPCQATEHQKKGGDSRTKR